MKDRIENLLSRFPRNYAKLLRIRGSYNVEKLAYLALLKRGDTVVEAGANHGYYTRLFSRVTGPRGQVHAFEPVPSTYRVLKSNCDRAKLPHNLTLNQLGLSDTPGKSNIYLPGDDHGQASLAKHDAGSWESPDRVETCVITLTTLDAYAEDKGLTNIDFFKLDIEGAEPLALQGASETIQTSHPLIHLEVNTAWLKSFGWRLSQLAALMRNYGYDTACAYEESPDKCDAFTILQDGITVSTNVLFAVADKHAPSMSNLKFDT